MDTRIIHCHPSSRLIITRLFFQTLVQEKSCVLKYAGFSMSELTSTRSHKRLFDRSFVQFLWYRKQRGNTCVHGTPALWVGLKKFATGRGPSSCYRHTHLGGLARGDLPQSRPFPLFLAQICDRNFLATLCCLQRCSSNTFRSIQRPVILFCLRCWFCVACKTLPQIHKPELG